MQIYEVMRIINLVAGTIFAAVIVVLGIRNGQRRKWFTYSLPIVGLLVLISSLFLAGMLKIGDSTDRTNMSSLIYTTIICVLFWYALPIHNHK